MSKLVFDIETIGEDFDKMDKITQKSLTKNLDKKEIEDMKEKLGLYPLTGEIVAIGVLDVDQEKGAVYYQAPGEKIEDFEENGIKFKACTEKEMLENFWKGAEQYSEFISFNGRGFDVPYMFARSAVHKVRPSKNLLSNRYLNLQKFDALHIDLKDQLSYYGAVWKTGTLHLWCRALGIKSPKENMNGDEVGEQFKEKKYIDIAKYNVDDLWATKNLYKHWEKYLKF